MLMNDLPLAVNLAKPQGEAKIEGYRLAARLDISAVSDGGSKGDFVACVDLNVVEIEFDGRGSEFIEQLPGLHIGVDSAREEGRGNVEHKDAGVVMCANGFEVFIANGL